MLQAVSLPFFKNHKRGQYNQTKTHHIIPLEFLAQKEHGKNHEYGQGQDFLNGFQFSGAKITVAETVGRHLQAVFKKGDEPADDNHPAQAYGGVFKVSVPGDGHENVGKQEQADG